MTRSSHGGANGGDGGDGDGDGDADADDGCGDGDGTSSMMSHHIYDFALGNPLSIKIFVKGFRLDPTPKSTQISHACGTNVTKKVLHPQEHPPNLSCKFG